MRFRLLGHRRFTLFVGVLLWCWISFSFESIGAQSDAEPQWYYGYREAPVSEFETVILKPYDVIAYTLDGQVVPLIEAVNIGMQAFTLDSNLTVILAQKDDQTLYYEVQGTDIVLLEGDSTGANDDLNNWLIDYHPPYAIFSNDEYASSSFVVADLESHTVALFESILGCCAWSADDRLQYLTAEPDQSMSLVEHDLKTGETETLFTDPDLGGGLVNASKDRWLLDVYQPDTDDYAMIVWHDDHEISRKTAVEYDDFRWVGDSLYYADNTCEQDCAMTLEAMDGENTTFSVTYPDAGLGTQRFFFATDVLPDGSLAGEVINPFQLVKISPDGVFNVLGDHLLYAISIPGDDDLIADNGSFAIILTDLDTRAFAVIDPISEARFLTSEIMADSDLAEVSGFPEGILMQRFSDEQDFQYYRASDGEVFELPTGEVRYFDVVNDDTLLYIFESRETTPHIGLYHLETGEQQVIVENAWPIPDYPQDEIGLR